MANNSVTNSRLLADIALNKRSRAYSDLRAICWDNNLQSDQAAIKLSGELESVLIDLLSGNFETFNRKMAEHSTKPSVIMLRPVRQSIRAPLSLTATTKAIRIGEKDAVIETSPSDSIDAEEIIYKLVLRALESGDIQHLALCQRCGTLFYRKNVKGTWCGDECRWAHFNSLEGREEKAHDRYVRRVRKVHPHAPVARRPRKKQQC